MEISLRYGISAYTHSIEIPIKIRYDIAVRSSSLLSYGVLAQLVEQWPEEPRVVGSIPTDATIYMRV